LKGLNRRNPLLAGALLVLMLSLAGVPPILGFYAKLVVLQAVIQSGLVWLAVLAIVMALIGAFYYLRVIKVMYFDEPSPDRVVNKVAAIPSTVLSLNVGLILLLALFPGSLMSICIQVIRNFL